MKVLEIIESVQNDQITATMCCDGISCDTGSDCDCFDSGGCNEPDA